MHNALAALLSASLVASHSTALTAADAEDDKWVQLTPAGTFSGRNGQGPWTTGDKASMERIVANTRQYAGSTDLAIDYDHQAVFGAVPGVGGKAPAAGWIKELKAQDDGIYGRVEWTAAAATAIKAKEYRYLSPVFFHEKTSGRVLAIRMAGLTNTPNLDLIAVAASALFPLNNQTGDSMDKILAALNLAKGTNEDDVVAAINSYLTSSTAIAKAAGLTDTAKPDEIVAAVNSIVADRTKFAEAAGLAATAKSEEIVTAVQSAIAGKVDPSKFVPVAAVTELQTRLNKLESTVGDDKAEEAVNTAMKAGKLIPALKDWGLALFKSDPAKFETFVGSAPVLTDPQLRTPRKGETVEALDEAQLAICSALGIAPAEYRKTIAAEQEVR
ncbi:phage protease [Mesorhizobium qingshengii]|uniref:Mu-like prophage I protein n=1 Tax=Mesorhizobium qingshengii TaxID=1165689 RepID=A0A1G5V2H9_9HYPH|nr:phage protease [Mesorhizobium qingshengii]SDA39205.1 Mu-like prophage I protein [Mesorhizobium qingshengii]